MEQFIETIKKNVEAFELLDIKPYTNLIALENWDSIALLSLMSMISFEYGVNLNGVDIVKAATPEAIFNLINNSK